MLTAADTKIQSWELKKTDLGSTPVTARTKGIPDDVLPEDPELWMWYDQTLTDTRA